MCGLRVLMFAFAIVGIWYVLITAGGGRDHH